MISEGHLVVGFFRVKLYFCIFQVEESGLTLHTADYFAHQRVSLR